MRNKNYFLELESRRKIYQFILKHPGVYLREISRELKVPKSTIDYHLRYLKKRDFIIAKSEDKYTRYYVLQNVSREHKKALSIIRKKTPRHIILFLSFYHISTRKELCYDLEKSASTISFHLNKLIEMGIVEKFQENNMVKYRLKDERATDKILFHFKKSYLDDIATFFFNYVERKFADRSFYQLICLVGTAEPGQLEKNFYEIFPHPYHA